MMIMKRGLPPTQTKRQVTLRLDADVLDWFRDMGHGYQTRINSVLKAYKQAHKPG
ncbi:MAG: BrnA antitoxin family protein [Magnetococcales bacterium]|nr:BrnA antitoxin family protein [Magnetococcales bacterium]